MLGALQSILYVRFNLFTVKEFDEEIDGEIHHKHHLLTTVALCAEPDYHQDAEQPDIFSDDEDEPFTRAWPDQDIPRRQGPAPAIPESARQELVKNLLLQHSTAVKVLSRLGVDACKEYQRSSAIGVLARVRQGNKICSICKESFSSTQVLRTHIQGQHMGAPHLKCSRCEYHAGDAYSSGSTRESMILLLPGSTANTLGVTGATPLAVI